MLDPQRRSRGPGKQIEFPPEQSHHRLLTPILLGASIVCALIVIIVVSTDKNGPFIGPW
jgi:hypothetical protein